MTAAHDFLIPEFELGDRMGKALRARGYSVQEAAEYFDVSRNTVGNWINNHTPPNMATLRAWAFWTGVPLTWLQTGEKPSPNNGDGLRLPRLDSNQKPPGKLVYARFRTIPLGAAA